LSRALDANTLPRLGRGAGSPAGRYLAARRKKVSQALSSGESPVKAASTSAGLVAPDFSSSAPLAAIFGVSFCQSPVVRPLASLRSSVRFSLGATTTEAEIDEAVSTVAAVVAGMGAE